MKISWRLIGFGIAAYAVSLLIAVPAEFVLPRFQNQGVNALGVTGSIWKGHAAALQIGRMALGSVDWDVRVLRLFTGKITVFVHAKRDDGSLQGTIGIGFGKRITVRQLEGSLPIASLGGFGLPGGWQGNVRLDLSTLELESNWPVDARGTIVAMNLVGPTNQPMPIGDFKVEFNTATTKDGLTGTLTSAGNGPFDANGTLRLQPNRNYVIDAFVSTRPGAPPQLANALQYLGPPDAQGRRTLSMSGSL